MEAECPPVWRALYDGLINVGDELDETIASTNPSKIIEENNSTFLIYYKDFDPAASGLYMSGVQIEAIDGKLVSAHCSSCTWTFLFFDELDRTDEFFPFGYRKLPGGRAMTARD